MQRQENPQNWTNNSKWPLPREPGYQKPPRLPATIPPMLGRGLNKSANERPESGHLCGEEGPGIGECVHELAQSVRYVDLEVDVAEQHGQRHREVALRPIQA